MSARVVRVAVYSGVGGMIIGTVFGVAVSTIEPRGAPLRRVLSYRRL